MAFGSVVGVWVSVGKVSVSEVWSGSSVGRFFIDKFVPQLNLQLRIT